MLRNVKTTRANPLILASLWFAAAVVFFVCEAVAAASVASGYSYAANFISELGVPGSTPLAAVMNLGFWLQGLLFLAGAVRAIRETDVGWRRLFIVLVSVNLFGDILVATFHGDALAAGDNEAAALHWFGSLFAIIGGNAAIIAGSSVIAGLVKVRWYRPVSVLLAVLGILSLLFVGHAIGQQNPGAWERASVYSILVWQILSAVLLIARTRTQNAEPVARQR